MVIYSAKLARRKTDIHFHNDIGSGAKTGALFGSDNIFESGSA
jgi:hypothetical protein